MGVTIEVVQSGKNAPRYSLNADLNGKLTLQELGEFTRRVLISTSKTVLREEQKQGFDKEPRKRIDNQLDRKEEDVKPFGKIEYFSRVDFSVAILRMYEIIVSRSAVVTGQYRSGNLIFVNGILVARSVGQLKRYIVDKANAGGFQPNDEIRFLNANPYARRLENKGIVRGVRGKFSNKNQPRGGRTRENKGKTIVQPNGTYFLSLRAIKSRFKQVASFISFEFMPNGSRGIYIRKQAGQRNTFIGDGRPYLYPSIVLKLSTRGIRTRNDS